MSDLNRFDLSNINGLPDWIKNGKFSEVSVYGDGKHRTAIPNVNKVIINHKSDKVNEPELLIISEHQVFKVSIIDGDFSVTVSKLGEVYDSNGFKIGGKDNG